MFKRFSALTITSLMIISLFVASVFAESGTQTNQNQFPSPITDYQVLQLNDETFSFSISTNTNADVEVIYGVLDDESSSTTIKKSNNTDFIFEIPLDSTNHNVTLTVETSSESFSTVMEIIEEHGRWSIINQPHSGSLYSYESISGFSLMANNYESEPNDTTGDAETGINSNDNNFGTINPSGDVDLWQITIAEKQYINIFLDVPSNRHYLLHIYHSSGTLIATSQNGSGQNQLIANQLVDAGTYYIRISGSSSFGPEQYLMRWRTTKQWPVPDSDRITQGYSSGTHNGIDIGGSTAGVAGDDIVASFDGTVSRSGWSPSYGWVVYINHNVDGQNLQTRYAHMDDPGPIVNQNDAVAVGQKIGEMGDTGDSFGVHLHFETRHCSGTCPTGLDNSPTPVDPLITYFPEYDNFSLMNNLNEISTYTEIDLESDVFYSMDEINAMSTEEKEELGIPVN